MGKGDQTSTVIAADGSQVRGHGRPDSAKSSASWWRRPTLGCSSWRACRDGARVIRCRRDGLW